MTKIILTVVLGCIAATAVGVWYFSGFNYYIQGTTQPMESTKANALDGASSDQMKGKDSLLALFKLGKSMECTFSFSSEGMKGEGTGYFDKNKSRVDSLYAGGGTESIASYMITDDTTKMMYTWFMSEGKMSGMKMTIPDEVVVESGAAATPWAQAPTPQVTPETDVTYDCKPWTVDSSVFVPPNNVEFTDMSEMQKQMEEMQRGMEALTMPSME